MGELYYLIAVTFSFLVISRLLMGFKQRLPPGPSALPIIGHLHILKNPLHQTLKTLSSRYGPVMYLRFGSRPAVILSSPSVVEECYTKRDVALANRPCTLAGDHLSYGYTAVGFAPYGDTWRTLRRLMVVESLSANRIQELSSLREEEVIGLSWRLFHLSASGPQEVDLRHLFSLLTANIFSKIVAGRPVYKETRGMPEKAEMEERLLAGFKERFYASVWMNICDYVPILRLIGYKGLEKGMIRTRGMRDEYLQSLIDEVRSNQKSKGTNKTAESKSSMIKSLLSLQRSDPDLYSDDIIKSIIMVMFTAGTDTTSVTLEWAMSLLLTNPEALRKLRAEVDSRVGHRRMLNDSDLANLPYLRCVVNETLRLYPATPLLLPHSSSQECTIKGYKVPRGTIVLVNAWAMHRDPKIWEDPDEFKPERFEGFVGERCGFRYIPFGAGRRACPGAPMALRTIMLALGSMVQCFEWELVGQVDMSELVGFTLSKAKPLKVVCVPRQLVQEGIFAGHH